MAEFATLADLKAHLNMSSSAHDGELTLMLDAAGEVVAGMIGHDFSPTMIDEPVRWLGGTVMLSRRPVVGNVLINDGTVAGFTVNHAAGLLYGVPYTYAPLVATYTVGDGQVPAAVTLATLVIAAHLWESQRGTSPTALQAADTNEFVPGIGFTVPNRAKELLDPHMPKRQSVA